MLDYAGAGKKLFERIEYSRCPLKITIPGKNRRCHVHLVNWTEA